MFGVWWDLFGLGFFTVGFEGYEGKVAASAGKLLDPVRAVKCASA